MKTLPWLIFSLIAFCSCGHKKSTLEASIIEDYRLIRDDLYIDDEGNLYHRTVDVSVAENPENPEKGKVYAYRYYLRMDTIIDGNETSVDIDLKDIVDTATFHRVESGEENAGYELYEDKNTTYYMKIMADGGTLSATRK